MSEGKRKIGMFEEINVQNGPQETLREMVVRTEAEAVGRSWNI